MKHSDYLKAVQIAETLQQKGKKVTVNKLIVNSVFIPSGSLTHVSKEDLKKVVNMYKAEGKTVGELNRYKPEVLKQFLKTNGITSTEDGITTYSYKTLTLHAKI